MAEVRAIEFDDALISLQGLLGAELQVIVNFYGTMCGCYLVGCLTKIETLHPEESAVNLVLDDRHGVLLDPTGLVEILEAGNLDEDGFLGFHLPREVEISIQRKRG